MYNIIEYKQKQRRKYKIGTDLSTLFIDESSLIGNKDVKTKLQLFTNVNKVKP